MNLEQLELEHSTDPELDPPPHKYASFRQALLVDGLTTKQMLNLDLFWDAPRKEEERTAALPEVRAKAAAKDLASMHELALRYQTGYAGVVKDSEAATTLWNEMIDRCDSESSWRGLAFAALVAQIPYWQTPQIFKPANQRPAYYKEDGSIGFAETPMPFTMDRMDEIMGADWREELVLAAQRADEAARLGYGETPAVWNVAVFAHPYRAHFDLEGHKHLWNTFEERWSRIAGGNEKWSQDKSKVSPYHCANDACPNSTKHRTDYKKCGGKCEDPFKPAYCSKQCQRTHWTSHKPFCRADVTEDNLPEREDKRVRIVGWPSEWKQG